MNSLIRRTLAAWCMLLALLPAARGAPAEPEDALKAAIVLGFLRFSDWPEPAPADRSIRVGVLGRSSLVEIFRRSLEGKSVADRVIRIIEIKVPVDPHCCQVIYLASQKAAEIKQALEHARAARVLTIGETDRFLDYGGTINLQMVDGHMSFEVSLEALGHSDIRISSKVLRLGQVRGKHPA